MFPPVARHVLPFGLVAVEAQACGTPVVASRVGGLAYAVEHDQSGYLIAGHDPADYAAALGFVKASAPAPLAWIAAGYSFGAATALTIAAADPSVCEVVVVAPPVAMLTRLAPFAADARRVTVIAATEDDFAPLEDLCAAFAHVASARIVTVPGADHFFSGGGLDRVVAAAADS